MPGGSAEEHTLSAPQWRRQGDVQRFLSVSLHPRSGAADTTHLPFSHDLRPRFIERCLSTAPSVLPPNNDANHHRAYRDCKVEWVRT